ncbi:MAG: class I SAM-dependent methyltransferase [Deltaproteobacteria bacterium]|jgi:ubiquinone/menaquinone biosynthesis C-methylase UbiE|nr:class I SAM-dependent methyltransferase [Deltaproteobacteria bacterium]
MGEYFYRKQFIQNLLYKRRWHRVDFLLSKVRLFPEMSILDVGCGPDGRSLEKFLHSDYRIVGIDLYDETEVKVNHPRFTYFQQDARSLSRFRDKEFDLALSIGMMEHICDRAMLSQMACEINRVSKQYVIVVPWKYAWIEPHFKFPFFQLLPYRFKLALTKMFDLHNLREKVKIDAAYIRNHYQWLSNPEWQRIFVGSKVYVTPTLETIAIIKPKQVHA